MSDVWRTLNRLTRTWQRTCCDPGLRCGLGASPCLEPLPPSAMAPNWSWPSPGQMNICFVVAQDDTKNPKYQRLLVLMRFVYYCHLLITCLNTFLLLRCCCAGMAGNNTLRERRKVDSFNLQHRFIFRMGKRTSVFLSSRLWTHLVDTFRIYLSFIGS